MTVILAPPLLLVKEKLAKFLPDSSHCTLELELIVWNSAYVTTTNKKNTPCCKVSSL